MFEQLSSMIQEQGLRIENEEIYFAMQYFLSVLREKNGRTVCSGVLNTVK